MSWSDQLVNEIVNLLSSFMIKGGESLAEKSGEKIGKNLSKNINKLFFLVKRKFENINDNNKDDILDLENFQRNPQMYCGQLKYLLKDKINKDDVFASDLLKHTQKIKEEINLNITMENIKAEGDVKGAHIDEIIRGNINHYMGKIESKGSIMGPTICKSGT